MNPPLYRLNKLRKVYDRRTVLDLDELSLEKGKILSLMGPNGAGKSTLLEILAFLLAPSSGELWFQGRKIDSAGRKGQDLRRQVVMVNQKPILFTTTVFKNVEFPLKIRKLPRDRRRNIVGEVLKLVGMEAFENARAHTLSGGETQRVSIAQALACEPEVILMDEPTASVDAENQITIERIVREINRKWGISVIFTTHDRIQASRLADETVFLFDGKLTSASYENIFSGQVETAADGCAMCVIRDNIKMRVEAPGRGEVRIAIDPASIGISRRLREVEGENAFLGRILLLSEETTQIRALVDIGVLLNVLIPRETFGRLSVQVGERVWIRCHKAGIHIF